MGKSLIDTLNDTLEAVRHISQYSRKVEVCSGIQYNSTYGSKPSFNDNNNVLEINGKGRIVAIIPFSTSGNYYGGIQVEIDDEIMVEGTPYYYSSSCLFPFLISEGFNQMLPNFVDHNSSYGHKGLRIPEVNTNNWIIDLDYASVILYNPDGNKQYYGNANSNGTIPISFDFNSKEASFKNSLKIKATQSNGTGYTTYSKLLVIYDLYD